MLTLKKLLLPVDYSSRSLAAAECVEALARRCKPHVTVLHVASAGEPDAGGEARGAATPRSDFAAALERLAPGIEVEFAELTGDPASVIVEYSRRHGADLIVMPTRGHGALRRFLLGSVTAKVLHDADCPVWTGVHAADEQAPPKHAAIGHVACAIDLGPQSQRLLRWASDFAAFFDARLSVIHTSTQLEPVIGVVHDPEWRAHVRKAIRTQLDELLRDSGVQAEIRLEPGEPAKAVTAAAAEIGAGVLVIGRTPDGLPGRLRTNAYAIIRQSLCPVVSV